MVDLNLLVRQQLDKQLYQATCKGVSVLTDNTLELTFEKDGVTLELRVFGDAHGVTPTLSPRR